MNSKNYEQLVQELYQALVDQSGIPNIVVQHNVRLLGTSGLRHQIDVHWEFELAGVRHRTCIECRHYGTKIKKSAVAAFSRTIQDLHATGIMVTTAGYQTGAEVLAAHDGIRLMQVVPLLRKIEIHVHLEDARVVGTELIIDPGVRAEISAKYPGADVIVTAQGLADTIFLVDETGMPQISFDAVHKRILRGGAPHGFHVEPTPNLYLPSTHGLVPIAALRCEVYRVNTALPVVVAGGEHIARALVRGLATNGSDRFFHAHGEILEVGDTSAEM